MGRSVRHASQHETDKGSSSSSIFFSSRPRKPRKLHLNFFVRHRLPSAPAMRLPADAARALTTQSWQSLTERIPERNDRRISYSRKVFIPLTRLCQDACGYCTFAHHQGLPHGHRAYLTPDEIMEIARQGADAGCTEALFTLGDRPEARWPVAREELALMGKATPDVRHKSRRIIKY